MGQVLSGTILGMTPREIRNCEDAISDFSGVRDFIKTPVKYYCNGMFSTGPPKLCASGRLQRSETAVRDA